MVIGVNSKKKKEKKRKKRKQTLSESVGELAVNDLEVSAAASASGAATECLGSPVV